MNAVAVEILSFSQSSSSGKDLTARLFPLVLDVAASQFKLQKYSSAAKDSSSRSDYPYSSWPSCYDKEEKGRRDASVVVSLYQQLFHSDRNKASELLSQLQSQTESLPYDELDRLIVPLLEQMMYIVDLCPLDACRFYQSMMATYITRVVQEEPKKPSDWSRPDERGKCYRFNCPDCPSLHEFLIDPGRESGSFTLPKDPWHLTSMVPQQCTESTDKSQEPPVLIVTKTLKGWEENHSKWQKRASKARETFNRFPQKELKQCLAEKYDAIMDLRMVKLQDQDSTIQPIHPSQKSVGNLSNERPRKRFRSDS